MSTTSVFQEFQLSVADYADRPFLHIPSSAMEGAGDVDFTYAEANAEVTRLIESYSKTGLSIGDRVAMLMGNQAEFFMHWFALNSYGVSVVPVNAELQPDEMAYLLENSDARLAVSLADKIHLLQNTVDQFKLNIPVAADTSVQDLVLPAPKSKAVDNASTQNIGLETECALLYTSGSTGKPKGCVLSNDYFVLSGAWYRDAQDYCKLVKGKERLITPLPLTHMNAMACSTMGMVMTGGCLVQLDRFHPRSWVKSVRDSKATVLHYLGVMPAILLNIEQGDIDVNLGDQIKFGFGAGVNPKHHAPFEKRFGFPLIESWGMTESGITNCITAIREPRHVGTSCIGKLPSYLQVKLVDEAGTEVEQGYQGELLVRASGDNPRRGFFTEYYKNPEATAETWEGGWLHTGDVLRQAEDGSYHFVDRIKNVIRRSGENISALEVEACLSLDANIGQIAVTAVPDEIRGDEVFASVILKNNSTDSSRALDPSTLEQLANSIFLSAAAQLTYYKLPGYIAFVSELPLTASNKPQRAELKKMAHAIVADFDQQSTCFDLRSLKKKSVNK